MKILLEKFGGLYPGIAPHLLPQYAAQVATNCKLTSGALRAWQTPLEVKTLEKTGTIQGLFFYEGAYWFHWLNAVKAVKSPLANDTWKRVYFCDDGPKMTANDVALAGSDYPAVAYTLGVPQPASAPAASVGGTPTSSDPTDAERRAYVFTYLTKYGEEGVPSAASSMVDVYPGQYVDLSGLLIAPAGNTVITHKRIYRTNTGSEDTAYQLVATLAIATTTYKDEVAAEDLGIVLESAEYNEPPSDLTGLTVLPCGSLAGYRGTEVCFSEPYKPHAWPLAYRVPVESTIQGIGAFSNMLLVATSGTPYVIVGDTPGAMSRDKLEIGQACLAPRGMVDMGAYLLYPGPAGLVRVGSGQYDIVSQALMSQDEWTAYAPSSIHAYLYDNKYLAFYNNGTAGAFLFDPEAPMFTELELTASGAYSDPATGKLYLVQDQTVTQFDAGEDLTDYGWKSRPILTPPVNFGLAQVYADRYPVTLTVYADKRAVHTQTVLNEEPFRLPSGFRCRTWELQLEGTATVNQVVLANIPEDLQ